MFISEIKADALKKIESLWLDGVEPLIAEQVVETLHSVGVLRGGELQGAVWNSVGRYPSSDSFSTVYYQVIATLCLKSVISRIAFPDGSNGYTLYRYPSQKTISNQTDPA